MARTAITPQSLDLKTGEVITFVTADSANGMSVPNDGKGVLLVQTAAASSGTVTIPTVACSHNRTAVVQATLSASQVRSLGPFPIPEIWGDGVSTLFIDFSGLAGTVTVAYVTPIGS